MYDSLTAAYKQRKLFYLTLCLLNCLNPNPALAAAKSVDIAIQGFVIEGNHVLTDAQLQAQLLPFLGPGRRFADIQKALETLQQFYRDQGYGEAVVSVPAQELNAGIIRFSVIEPILADIHVEYQPESLRAFYPESKIRANLPALQSGLLLRSVDISQNIQLANENPARKMAVVLSPGADKTQLDATVKVSGLPPRKAYTTIDNTGTALTGEYRMGFGLQHANLWGRDHVGTFNYITPIESPTHVNLFSGSYRIPLYGWGDSLDISAAKSDVGNSSTDTVAGPLQFAGSGEIYALNYNLLLPRWGEYSHRLVAGYNYRQFNNHCTIGVFGSQACGPSGHEISLMPLSVNYSGQFSWQAQTLSFYLLGAHNLPGMAHGSQNDFTQIRPAFKGGGGAPAEYNVFRSGFNFNALLVEDWQLRLAGNGQFSPDALVYAEQFSLAGSTMVRGFWEREVTRDTGFVLNNEIYGPDLAELTKLGDHLRGLVFYDYGAGQNNALNGERKQALDLNSVGFGIRLGFNQSLQLKFDGSYVLSGAASHPDGDVRGHLSVYLPYSF